MKNGNVEIRINVFSCDNKFIESVQVKGEPGTKVPVVFGSDVPIIEDNIPSVFPEVNTMYKVRLLTPANKKSYAKELIIGISIIATATTGLLVHHLISDNK